LNAKKLGKLIGRGLSIRNDSGLWKKNQGRKDPIRLLMMEEYENREKREKKKKKKGVMGGGW